MIKRFAIQQLFCIATICWLCMSCANESSPQGGPKDNEAPVLASRTMQDSMLRFKGGTISFAFNEKIDANNITIETFPLMPVTPKAVVNKKIVSITLPDTALQANTTYKISFGNSIKDIYEGTAYNNLGFTFSTGDVLDSLQISGKVIKAKTGEPDTSATILLYPIINSDTDINYKKAMYAAKVSSSGDFTISNLPNKTFYCYAVSDINKNYKYDYPTESIAFIDSTITPTAKPTPIVLYSFLELPDTASPRVKNFDRENTQRGFSINVDTSNATKRTFDFTEAITITSQAKLMRWDKTKIRLFIDNIQDETGVIVYDSVLKKIKINTELQQNTVYKLILLDSFAADTNGAYKGNTYIFRTKNEADYGILTVNYPIQKNSYPHVLQVIQNNKIITTQTIKDSITQFKLLPPGSYTLKILHDANNNGSWDNGSYKTKKQQPELVEKYLQDAVIKANWINAIDWYPKEKKRQ